MNAHDSQAHSAASEQNEHDRLQRRGSEGQRDTHATPNCRKHAGPASWLLQRLFPPVRLGDAEGNQIYSTALDNEVNTPCKPDLLPLPL